MIRATVTTLLTTTLLVLLPTSAAQNGSNIPLDDASFWKRFDWTASNSPIWQNGWGPPTVDTEEPEFYETRSRGVVINGKSLELRSYLDRRAIPQYRMQIVADGDEANCGSIRAWASAHFGDGVGRRATRALLPLSTAKWVDEEHEWIVGSSSVRLLCLGVAGSGEDSAPDVLIRLTFQSEAREGRIPPLVRLKCTSEDPGYDLSFGLDERRETIFRDDLSLLAPSASFHPTSVIWRVEKEGEPPMNFVLNRMTGRLRTSREELAPTTVWWNCERSDPADRKF
jgi:hypothetical protein